jgi:hypothetical protein
MPSEGHFHFRTNGPSLALGRLAQPLKKRAIDVDRQCRFGSRPLLRSRNLSRVCQVSFRLPGRYRILALKCPDALSIAAAVCEKRASAVQAFPPLSRV